MSDEVTAGVGHRAGESAWQITWTKGGEARVVSASADTIVLISSIPSPPGSRIEGVVSGGEQVAIKVKIHASRRQDDGTFRLDGRPLDLTREVRERLVALASVL